MLLRQLRDPPLGRGIARSRRRGRRRRVSQRGSRSQVTATTGVVAPGDDLSGRFDFIPHTAPLNPGNSGGPLFSMPDAKVLGINTARGTQTLVFYAVPFQAIEGQMAEWRSQLVVIP